MDRADFPRAPRDDFENARSANIPEQTPTLGPDFLTPCVGPGAGFYSANKDFDTHTLVC